VTINSISGGKTSAYMAKHFQADVNIFALVRIEAEYCKPKDKSLIKYVSDKIAMDFIATAESDKTLYVVRDMEQVIGKQITWVTGETFESVIRKKKALPNREWRFCTTEMKIKPIFEYCQENFEGLVDMNIGFRYDEKERVNYENTTFKAVVGKSPKGRNKWKEIEWRKLHFPLVDNRVYHFQVAEWAKQSGLIFPADSNCVGCFWKPPQQLRKNWDDEPHKMRWFSEMEQKLKRTFKSEITYEMIKSMGLQSEFVFGTGSGCKAGFCHD
jgi:hypothetical protein